MAKQRQYPSPSPFRCGRILLYSIYCCSIAGITLGAPSYSCRTFVSKIRSSELLGYHSKQVEKQLPLCPSWQVGVHRIEKRNFLEFNGNSGAPVSTIVHRFPATETSREVKKKSFRKSAPEYISFEAVVPQVDEGVKRFSILRISNGVTRKPVLSLEWERREDGEMGKFVFVEHGNKVREEVVEDGGKYGTEDLPNRVYYGKVGSGGTDAQVIRVLIRNGKEKEGEEYDGDNGNEEGVPVDDDDDRCTTGCGRFMVFTRKVQTELGVRIHEGSTATVLIRKFSVA